jgi:hypothetical protein
MPIAPLVRIGLANVPQATKFHCKSKHISQKIAIIVV